MQRRKRRDKHLWTADEEAMLSARYPHENTVTLAAELGLHHRKVHSKAARMGLKKTPEYLREQLAAAGRKVQPFGSATRFGVGFPPWNKGLKGLNIGGTASRFKPGNRPHTWVPVGTERVVEDGVLERKVTDDGPARHHWRPVHRIVWEAAHGPMPKGHVIRFRDGDKRNFALDNLHLVTRAELLAENSVHNLPENLKDLIRTKGRLTRLINDHTRKAS